MNQRLDAVFKGWLAAESDGRDREAEHALRRIFGALRMPAPAAGFADRVLSGVGLLRPPVAVYPWWSRAAIAACLLLAGLALTYTLPLVFGLTRLVAPGELAGAAVRGFVGLISRVDEVLSIWRFCAGVVETLMLVATAPPVVLTLLALTALSAFTFRGLSDLVSPHRSQRHV